MAETDARLSPSNDLSKGDQLPGRRSTSADRPEWITLRTAPNQLTAELWREFLLSEGIPATLAPADAVSFMGLSPAPCRLLVPDSARDTAERALSGEMWAFQPAEG